MTLNDFVAGWLSETPIMPPIFAVNWVNGNTGITLYRDDRFQVQMWVFPPNAVVTDHSHPGVDTTLVWVAGKLRFWVDDEYVCLSETVRASWRGMKTWTIHIPPGARHRAEIGKGGASFLGITEQLDGGKPKSAHLIWDGPPLDKNHGASLVVMKEA